MRLEWLHLLSRLFSFSGFLLLQSYFLILKQQGPISKGLDMLLTTVARKGHGISWSVSLLQIFKLEISSFF